MILLSKGRRGLEEKLNSKRKRKQEGKPLPWEAGKWCLFLTRGARQEPVPSRCPVLLEHAGSPCSWPWHRGWSWLGMPLGRASGWGSRHCREPSPPHNPGPARAALAWRSWQPSLKKQPEGTSSSLFSTACQEPCGDAALPGTCSVEAQGCRLPALPRDGWPFPTRPGSCSGEGLSCVTGDEVGIPGVLSSPAPTMTFPPNRSCTARPPEAAGPSPLWQGSPCCQHVSDSQSCCVRAGCWTRTDPHMAQAGLALP